MADCVLVTGAGSGIGKAACEYLSDKGFVVYGAGRSAHETVGYRSVRMDITDPVSVDRCVGKILDTEGHIDVLVNNAGFMLCGPIAAMAIDELKYQFEVNFFSAVRVIHAVLPGMISRKKGTIINVGSIGGRIALPYHAAYGSSKAALMSLTDALGIECSGKGVSVCLVEPGDVNSSLSSNRRYTESIDSCPPAKKAVEIMIGNEKNGIEPSDVAKILYDIMLAKKKKKRYIVGKDAKLLDAVNRILPESLRRKIIENLFEIRKKEYQVCQNRKI